MNTSERLQNYGFSPETIETVAAIAEEQMAPGFADTHEFMYGLKPVNPMGNDVVRILDMRPKDHDRDTALFYHLPFVNPLDHNQRFQLETIAKALPTTRIIAFGNPSGPGYKDGALDAKQREAVIRGDLRPTVEPALRYAEQNKITSTKQVGYSFGADKAVEAAASDAFDVTETVCIEPSSLTRERLTRKIPAFLSTNGMLKHYVELSQTPAFEEARTPRKRSVGAVAVGVGTLRLTNIAIGRSLAQGGHMSRAERALHNHPENTLAEVWGSESELIHDDTMQGVVASLAERYPGQVESLRVEGGKHMIANDIYFHAAAVREFVKA